MGKTGKTKKALLVKKPAKMASAKKAVKATVPVKAPKAVKVAKKPVKAKEADPDLRADRKNTVTKVRTSDKSIQVKSNQDPLGMNNKKLPKQSATHLTPAFISEQKEKLMVLHDHLLDQMQSVAQDNLRTRPEGSEASAFGMHQADAGSDAYDKDFALSLLSQEQDALYEIEEALKRIENGAYGICEMSTKPIPKNRLEAIPFARFTVECQSQLEKENKGRRRWDTTPQFMDSEDSISDEDEEVVDEEGNRKEKE